MTEAALLDWVSLLLGFCLGALAGTVFGAVTIARSKSHTLFLVDLFYRLKKEKGCPEQAQESK